MRVVFAPDSFKGTADARTVARALAEGWASVRPGDELRLIPMADGGEGTVETVCGVIEGATLVECDVTGPDGANVRAAWLRLPDDSAVVELASSSGLLLLRDGFRPETAHTYGFGELIADALKRGASRVFAALGGSASTDGGAGMLRALGAEIIDGAPPENRELLGLPHDCQEVISANLRRVPAGGVEIWSDVTHPLLGEQGATAVFGPQKGVTADLKPVIEARLRRFADAVERAVGAPFRDLPGAGAAGGAGFGLLAWGGRMTRGSEAIARLVGLPAAIHAADVVVTGEGQLDAQSTHGKVVSEVAALVKKAASQRERPPRFAVVAGRIELADTRGRVGVAPGDPDHILSLEELAGSTSAAMTETVHWLKCAGARFAASVSTPYEL